MHKKLIFIVIFMLLAANFNGCNVHHENADSSAINENSSGVSTTATTDNKGGNNNLYNISQTDGKLAIWFFTLPGNDHTGESMLIRTPNGKTLLIDSGTTEAGKQVLDYLGRLGIKSIDYAVATHMHIDHIGGFPEIMENVQVKKVYTSPFTQYDSSAVKNYNKALSKHNLKPEPVSAGMKIEVDKGVAIEFIYPESDAIQSNSAGSLPDGDYINDTSVVFRLTYGDKSFLFTGDITSISDIKLVGKYGEKLKSDFMKVPHHGSADASSENLVKTVSPEYSVMCIYALNSLDIYDRYKKYGYRPYVTSLDGTILLVSDGKNINFLTEKERKGMLK